MSKEPEQVVWQGKFITAKVQGKWEYVSRARGIKAAVILAIDDADHVLLVELRPTAEAALIFSLTPNQAIFSGDQIAVKVLKS